MATKKNRLNNMLNDSTAKPEIRRGSGLRLSTEVDKEKAPQSTQSHNRTIAQSHNQAEKPKRVSRGYRLREDLIKACKFIALEENRNLYEIMEEAIQEYLVRREQRQKVDS